MKPENTTFMNFYFFLFAAIVLVLMLFYYRKLNNLKNYIYNISSFEENSKTKYYIVYEQKHGVFIDTKILGKLHAMFLKKHHIEILSKNYSDEDVALNSLEQFKQEINHSTTNHIK
jgi:hypothetical protein